MADPWFCTEGQPEEAVLQENKGLLCVNNDTGV